MKNQKIIRIISILLALLLVVFAASRGLQVIISPIGSGRSVDSPDQHYQTTASTLSATQFWGGERHYYEFTLEKISNDSRQVLKRVRVEPLNEKLLDWYSGQGAIEWASDSSAVTYQFGTNQLTLKLP
ncbi:MAG: hypothetical protein ACH34X_19505 [Thiolinea sp.]